MTMTTNHRRFRDSLLADRLIRTFAGGGALIFGAMTLSAVVQLMMEYYNGETPGVVLGGIALVSAAIAAVLWALYLKYVRRSQKNERSAADE
ncbi:hypothetical protein [uncultured Arthrobacter sp.]|uniref:hypothetical protein n=1 Tax=uncultured Arthrobacter sp. TaxID=114050 RepID=UPI002627BD4B|nr:hypothetical protein [uncultured Arthrobacter sp.]